MRHDTAKLKYLTMETREKHWCVPAGDSEQAPLCSSSHLQMHTCKWCLLIHEYWMDSCAPERAEFNVGFNADGSSGELFQILLDFSSLRYC